MRYRERLAVVSLPFSLQDVFRDLFMQKVLDRHVIHASIVSGTFAADFQTMTGTEREPIQRDHVRVNVVVLVIRFTRELGVHF